MTFDDDGMVAAISRAGAHIWQPDHNIILREADELIFYGDLNTLRQRIRPLIQQTIDARFSAPAEPQPWDVMNENENPAAWAIQDELPRWRNRRR